MPDIREPHQHRGEILPCRGDDFDLTRLLDGNRAQAGADGSFLQLAGGRAGQRRGERDAGRALEVGQAVAGPCDEFGLGHLRAGAHALALQRAGDLAGPPVKFGKRGQPARLGERDCLRGDGGPLRR